MRKTHFTSSARILLVLIALMFSAPAWSGSHFNYAGVDTERISLTRISVDSSLLRLDFSNEAGFFVFDAERRILRLFDEQTRTYRLIGPTDLHYLRQAAAALNSNAGRAADAVLGSILGGPDSDGSANPVRRQLAAALGLPAQDFDIELETISDQPQARQGHVCIPHRLRVNQQPIYNSCLADPAELGLRRSEIETLNSFLHWTEELVALWTELDISMIRLPAINPRIPVTIQRISSSDTVTTELQSISEILSLDIFRVPQGYRQQPLPWQR